MNWSLVSVSIAFRTKLSESELELLDKCAKRLLELIGFKHG